MSTSDILVNLRGEQLCISRSGNILPLRHLNGDILGILLLAWQAWLPELEASPAFSFAWSFVDVGREEPMRYPDLAKRFPDMEHQ